MTKIDTFDVISFDTFLLNYNFEIYICNVLKNTNIIKNRQKRTKPSELFLEQKWPFRK